jgi:hypothetical protein
MMAPPLLGNVAFNLRDVATEVIGVDIAPGMVETVGEPREDVEANVALMIHFADA